jgi:type IV secretory pathway VirB10-like protein
MKKFFIVFIALALVACGTPAVATGQPTVTQAPPEPTQTAAVVVETVVEKVVETVVVTVVPTQVPTEVPSLTPLPPPTEVPPTQAVAATQPPAQAAAPADTTGGLIPVDDVLGAGWFVGMTRNRNDFALRCQLSKDITFSVKPADPNITQVQFYYRIEDRATGAVFDWQNAGKMLQDANGNFTLVFSGDSVNANFRKPNAWFDYQFVGLSKSGGIVGRSEKIIQQVSYTFDCP